jgi:tRNA(fMet)-specific endonuclease VapC
MLDTNICIYALKAHPPHLIAKLGSFSIGDLVMSTITLAELRAGVERNPATAAVNDAALDRLARRIAPVDFDAAAAEAFGRLQTGAPRKRGAYDRLIAAHALSLGVTVVTNNEADFEGVPGLKLENWAKGQGSGRD